MLEVVHALREAWSLYQSDRTGETVIAVLLVVVVAGPLVWNVVRSRGQ